MNTIVKFWMTVSMVLLVSACGYKPSSHMIQNVFNDTVYVEVIVDRVEPENAPFLKDEMNRLVYTRFKGRVVTKEQAQSQIRLSYAGSTFTPLAYRDGYVTRYRANVKVKFDMVNKEGKVSKTISSIVESDIQESSLDSSVLRTEAIRIGLGKALDEFLAYVSAKGMLKEAK
ncbi:LPS assembly lipoprotein LptE [Sulfurovum sp.]|uniref:LPS assembly lipoprotein LptE n=1 Tax=Sulfurovum sp. TaxID=1969726 RepID=UPI003568D518